MIENKLELPCGAIIKNRIAKSAMSENMADKDNLPNQMHDKLYSKWALGGAGLVITGNVMIDQNALGELNNVVMENRDELLERLSLWAQAGTKNNTHLWPQINHPGKQSPKFICPNPVAPSSIPYKSNLKNTFNEPRELKETEIFELIKRFGDAARISKEAGFTGVQIHGAHGYLIAQFLSPLHNHRKDQWGGSLENRMRFVVEIYNDMRQKVGAKFPIGIKLNSSDFQRGGFSEEESILVVKKLSELGIDLIEISGGTYEAAAMTGVIKKSTLKREAYFSEYCEKVKKEINTPIILTGGFRTPKGMRDALQSGDCDMIGMARCLAIDPDFPNKIFTGEDVKSLVKPLSSGYKFLDKMIPVEITWYTQQLQRIGKGKKALPNLSVKYSILRTILDFGLDSVRRVRG